MSTEDGKRPPETGQPEPDAAPDARPAAATPEAAPEAGVEAREQGPDLGPLAAAIDAPGMTAEAGLNLVETYDTGAIDDALLGELGMIAEDYGLSLDDLSKEDRAQLAALWLGAKRGRSETAKRDTAGTMDYLIGERLMTLSLGKIDRLTADVRDAETIDDLKDRLKDVMTGLAKTARNVPMDEEHEQEWEDIDSRFRELVNLKYGTEGEVRDAFSDAFEDHADFIEDQLVAARMEKSRGDVQQITQELYGRTKEEVEEIKRRNREAVVMLIREFGHSQRLDLSMLERLHEVNNKGIVPKKYSQLRQDPGSMPPTFFERIGLLAEDLKPELEALLKEADALRDKEIGDEPGQISKDAYAMRAAQLHNDLLDMHPFGDRNGSTALLFLETVMTSAGYEPSAQREKDFYKNLGNILGGEPTAMAIVREEQVRMATEPGYFVGESNKDPARRKQYDRILGVFRSLAGKPPVRPEEDGD